MKGEIIQMLYSSMSKDHTLAGRKAASFLSGFLPSVTYHVDLCLMHCECATNSWQLLSVLRRVGRKSLFDEASEGW